MGQHKLPKKKSIAASIDQTKQQPQKQPFDFSKVHLAIGLPTYGGQMSTQTCTSLIQFIMVAQQYGLRWSLDTMINESLVQRARNSLMAKMYQQYDQKATHFMFIDSDIGFNAIDILHMIAADRDIICGAYPKKSLPVKYNINLQHETKILGPIFTIDTAATGFLIFKREVQKKLMDAHPEWKYKDDISLGRQYEPYLYACFDCYIDKAGHYLSEDWAFSRRCQELGYEIWCDSRVELTHIGSYAFKGDVSILKMATAEDMTNLQRHIAGLPPEPKPMPAGIPTAIITETKK